MNLITLSCTSRALQGLQAIGDTLISDMAELSFILQNLPLEN